MKPLNKTQLVQAGIENALRTKRGPREVMRHQGDVPAIQEVIRTWARRVANKRPKLHLTEAARKWIS